ncbi:MAG: hypothetical protein ACQEXQ_08870 [Bacillota bacterium]
MGEEILKFSLATVTSNGLIFNDRVYTNRTLIKNNWFEAASIFGRWELPILYSDSNDDYLIDQIDVAVAIEHEENSAYW